MEHILSAVSTALDSLTGTEVLQMGNPQIVRVGSCDWNNF